MDWLKSIAPTVATALGGPLAGIAVEILGPKLGLGEATTTAVKNALSQSSLTQEQLNGLKQAEAELQAREMEYGFKFAELEFKDRESARVREVAMGDKVNRNLAYVVVGAFIAMIGATLLGYAKVESVLAGTLVGYLSAKAEQVLAYYFGSSMGSKEKTDLLSRTPPIPK